MNALNQLYLGRLIDEQDQTTRQDVLYLLEHLTTHGLILGATGSGKTGLGTVLVEEVLRQGVPVLLLDVKGDLANLLLTFPDLAPADFAPWIDADATQRKGQSPEKAAEAIAQRWRDGLAEWDLGPDQIADLRRRAEFVLYTPGSRAGRPVDVLARFGAPPANDPDEAALRAQGLTSALLGLAGVEADPIRSREHILLTTLIRHVWESGGTLDVPTLIQQVQHPPIERVGVFDMESFFPAKDRFTLALTLNNLVAAPGFALWREGEALDIERFLYAEDGRPRATVFYLAHLPEEQRHFFVTLFLEELRTWVRGQAGTRTLRALLYFDEIFGYMPPHPYNPPPKAPLLALLKQGRAAGMGVVLSTQNPGDLDYKALGNIGTWAVGALRTDRDKRRVLEGMEGAIAEAGLRVPDIETAISRLKPRLFLLHDARSEEPDDALRFFQSRWAMSYLRGPLTIAEVQHLVAPAPASAAIAPTPPLAPAPTPPLTPAPTPPLTPSPSSARLTAPPATDPDIPQAFLPATLTAAWVAQHQQPPLANSESAHLIYRPHLLGFGVVHIRDEKSGINLSDDQAWRIDPAQQSWNMHWELGQMIAIKMEDLTPAPPGAGVFDPLPGGIGNKTAHAKRESALKTHLYNNSEITLLNCPLLKEYSHPGETKAAFLERCRLEIEKRKEAELALERRKFEQKMAPIQTKLRKEELELQQDQQELSERKREELLSGAESVFGLFSRGGSKRALSQASRQRRYVQQAQGEVEESEEMIKHYAEEIQQLEATWQTTAQSITERWDAALTGIVETRVRAKRNDIEVRFCGLVWFPFWEFATDAGPVLLPAYAPQ
ncbi:MAG: DUF853 family protein [Anaerolineae bacterium]|nr:DUF853 family protein [Anaerolineae bacterium]